MDNGFDDEAGTSHKKPIDTVTAQHEKDIDKIARHKNWILRGKTKVKFGAAFLKLYVYCIRKSNGRMKIGSEKMRF